MFMQTVLFFFPSMRVHLIIPLTENIFKSPTTKPKQPGEQKPRASTIQDEITDFIL